MTYAEAAAWLDGRANLERKMDPAAWTSIKLERVERLCQLLGDPQRGGRVVHIAGSKGKGSVAAMVESVLRAAGLRTGLYTSPDLTSRRERIQVDGQPISETDFARIVAQRLQTAAAAYEAEGWGDELSYFDLLTALGFCWFAEQQVAWPVIEVGLGGRLDATNVVAPAVCAITTLCLEHTQFLGDTLALIAGEKAGIIKPGVPVVSAPQQPEAAAVLARVAAERGAPLLAAEGVRAVPGGEFVELADGRVGQRLAVEWAGGEVEVTLPLLGAHQIINAAVARTVLAQTGVVTRGTLAAGLAKVRWPGRLQVVARRPWVVLDGAHTPDSAARLREALALFPHRRLWLVLGSARDKNTAGLCAELAPGAAAVFVTGVPGNQRAMRAADLAEVARPHAREVIVADDPAHALRSAVARADADDLVCVTGSLYLVGAILAEG
ncbi:MAG: bifunctional folylpolyglutamate synthase/dihydrofolate synthase [Armatimonadetes bacterium]|nr:bifunctional folylpolyglutamate synthase/dihydrofolate synthase [Armatimonadota bacterium]